MAANPNIPINGKTKDKKKKKILIPIFFSLIISEIGRVVILRLRLARIHCRRQSGTHFVV